MIRKSLPSRVFERGLGDCHIRATIGGLGSCNRVLDAFCICLKMEHSGIILC